MIWKLSKDADSTASHMLREIATAHQALEIILMSFFTINKLDLHLAKT